MSERIELVTSATIPLAVDILCDAFIDADLFPYLIPDRDQRRRWLPVLHREMLRNTIVYGETYLATDEGGQGVGLIAATPPGHCPHPRRHGWRLTWNTFWRPHPFCPPLSRIPVIKRYETQGKAIHYKPPHWYVDVIGVRRAAQGKGFGRRLMGRILDAADRDGSPTYLDTQSERNVRFYESLGFEVTDKVQPAPDGPPLWGMLRKPRKL